jgi:broad specificity phosphatase PhoE
MQGQRDSDLNEVGRRQAEAHGRLLAELAIDALYASPLRRVRETVGIIRRFVDLPVRFDERLKEWDCGDWSGQLRAEIETRWPEEWAALAADPYYYRGPGCENYPDMIARARPFVDELHAGQALRVAVVSHGMIGRVMVGILMNFNEAQMLGFRQPNDVVYRVKTAGAGADDDRPSVVYYDAGEGPLDGVVER